MIWNLPGTPLAWSFTFFKRLIPVFAMFSVIGKLSAHTGFESSTEVRIFSDRMQVVVRTSYGLAWKLIGNEAPASSDEASQVIAKPLLLERAPGLFDVASGGIAMAPKKTSCQFELNKDVAFVLTYDRPVRWPLVLKARYFSVLRALDSGTISVFDQTNLPPSEEAKPFLGKILFANDPSLSVNLMPVTTTAATGTAPPVKMNPPGFVRFFTLGMRHILTGCDHLLFLLALLLGCRRLRPMLWIITAFTLAHSITLALAVFDMISIPSRWVESFIALSIVYVGLENFSKTLSVNRRIGLTFAFGLVHGLGFAGVLKEIGLGANGQSVVAPLLAFNLGVETGQLAVVAVLLPILFHARKQLRFERLGIPALSTIVVLLGGFWFVQRAFLVG